MPAWLGAAEEYAPAYLPSGRRRRRTFVDATLDGVAGVLGQVVLADGTAARRGPMQRLDARVVLVGLFVVAVGLSFVRHALVLVAVWLVLVGVAAASRVPLRARWRAWATAVVLTALVVAPATLSVVNGGRVVVGLWRWHGAPEGLTAQGLTNAGLVTARVGCSVALTLLVAATVSWTRLLAALGDLGVTPVIVAVATMAYRYLVLLVGVVEDMFTGRRARTVLGVRHDADGRALLGASVGALVGRAHRLADEVHQAMVARGWRGRTVTLRAPRLGAADLVAAAVVTGLVVAVLVVDGRFG